MLPRSDTCVPSRKCLLPLTECDVLLSLCFLTLISFSIFLFLPLVRKISLLPFRETIASRWFCTTEVAVLTFSYLLGRLALQASIPDQKASFSSFCKLLLNINGLCLIINQEVLPYDTVK